MSEIAGGDAGPLPSNPLPPTPPTPVAGRQTGAGLAGHLVLVPIGLALVAEAAWTAVVAGLLQVFALEDPTLGLPAMLLAAVAGWLAARGLGPRLGDRWPTAAGALAVGVATIGWLSDPEVRSILAGGGEGFIPSALVANLGGFVAGVAFLRGIAHARVPPDPRPMTTVLAVGTPGIAVAAIIGGMIADPWRSQFLGAATVDVIVFLVAGIASVTLARLTLVGSGAGAGVDWRRNPAWLSLLAALLVAIAGVAVATSLVAGPAIIAVLGALVPTMLVLGLVAGFDRRSLRILLICVAVGLALGQLLRLIGEQPREQVPIPAATLPVPGDSTPTTVLTIGIVGFAVVGAVIAAAILVRLWMRRPRVTADDLDEERWIDRGEQGERAVERRRRRGVRFGRGNPADAVAAYLSLLEDLARRPRVRREPGETPAEHAARLREEGWGALSLDLLAADYGLVRFGGRSLSRAEDRRAIARAALLRKRLTGPAASTGVQGRAGAVTAEGEGDTGAGPGARSRFRVG